MSMVVLISILCFFLVDWPSQGYKIGHFGQLSGSIYLNVTDANVTSNTSNTDKLPQLPQDRIYRCSKQDSRQCCQQTWSCAGVSRFSAWTTENIVFKSDEPPGFIKAGSYGQVWAVKRPDQNAAISSGLSENAAIKKPSPTGNRESCLDIVLEIQKIEQITEAMVSVVGDIPACASTFMTLIDKRPCERHGNGTMASSPASYVMERMQGDLSGWQGKFPAHCRSDITNKAMLAVRCLHLAGWVHSDVKEANLLWRGNDKGCPTEVRLADYGLAKVKGATRSLFQPYYNDKEKYFVAYYLPSDLFAKPPDVEKYHKPEDFGKLGTLGLQRAPTREGGSWQYEYQPEIDWCSFGLYFPGTLNPYWSGDCGLMGPGRKTHVKVKPLHPPPRRIETMPTTETTPDPMTMPIEAKVARQPAETTVARQRTEATAMTGQAAGQLPRMPTGQIAETRQPAETTVARQRTEATAMTGQAPSRQAIGELPFTQARLPSRQAMGELRTTQDRNRYPQPESAAATRPDPVAVANAMKGEPTRQPSRQANSQFPTTQARNRYPQPESTAATRTDTLAMPNAMNGLTAGSRLPTGLNARTRKPGTFVAR